MAEDVFNTCSGTQAVGLQHGGIEFVVQVFEHANQALPACLLACVPAASGTAGDCGGLILAALAKSAPTAPDCHTCGEFQMFDAPKGDGSDPKFAGRGDGLSTRLRWASICSARLAIFWRKSEVRPVDSSGKGKVSKQVDLL